VSPDLHTPRTKKRRVWGGGFLGVQVQIRPTSKKKKGDKVIGKFLGTKPVGLEWGKTKNTPPHNLNLAVTLKRAAFQKGTPMGGITKRGDERVGVFFRRDSWGGSGGCFKVP